MTFKTQQLFCILLAALGATFSDGFTVNSANERNPLKPATSPHILTFGPLESINLRKYDAATPAKSRLEMASKNVDSFEEPSWQFNPLYAGFWAAFVVFAALGPGEIGSPDDAALIQAYIDNPSDPGFSEAFQAIFNYLGLMPIILAFITLPQGSKRGLPAAPFFVSGFGLGYGGIAPYLAFRAPPKEQYVPSEASWFTRNVVENKVLSWLNVASVIALPFVCGFIPAMIEDSSATLQSYADLFAISKLVSASSVDALILNIVAATLIPRDLKLRNPEIEDSKANLIGASTLLFPFLGAALYCALRPALPTDD